MRKLLAAALSALALLTAGLALAQEAPPLSAVLQQLARTKDISGFRFTEPTGQKLRRLLSQATASNPLDAQVASGVTMSTTTTANAALTKQYKPDTTPSVFTAHGGTPTIYNVNFWAFPVSSVAPNTNGNLAGYFPATPDLQALGWEVEFVTDAPTVMVRMFGYNSSTSNFRIIVDGQYVTKAATTYAATGLSYVQLDFGGVRQDRRIQFRSMMGNAFGGALVDPLSTVWAADQSDTVKVAFTGDSYTDRLGVAGSTEMPDGMWCHVVGHLLGWRDVRQVAVGATGYINNGGTRSTIIQQIPRWIGTNPDVIVFAGGYNDPVTDPTALTSAALAAWRLARAGAPKAPIFILGNWPGAGSQSTTNLAKEAALLAAFQQFGDANAYFIPQENITVPWISGTGYVGATNGSGNSDIYISTDSVHPSSAGHIHLGRRAARQIADAVRSIAY